MAPVRSETCLTALTTNSFSVTSRPFGVNAVGNAFDHATLIWLKKRDRAEERPWRNAAELAPGDLTYEYTFHPKEIAAFRTSTRQPAAAHTIDGGFAYGFTKMEQGEDE